MNVPKGFKQTEVGVIPEDWEVKTISDVATVTTGPFGTLLKASEYSELEGVPLISVGEIGAGSFKVSETTPRIPSQVVRRLPQYVLKTGDIVFGRKGAVDRSALVSCVENGWFLGSDGIRIRPTIRYHSSYLACQFQGHSVKAILLQNAIGTTMPSLNQSILKHILLPIPPRAEQEAIAAALSDMDALIEGVEKLLEKKRRIKQGAMQELLKPKKGWKQIFLGSIADILTGFPFPSSGYSDDGIKLLRGSNVKRGNINWSKKNTKYWKVITHDIKPYELQAGDIVIAMDGSLVGKSFAQISEDDLPALLLQRVTRIRTDKVDINYICHLVCGKYFTIHCEQIKTSSAIPHISPKDIRDFQIPLPPTRVEQTAIAAILSDMNKEIEQVETQLTKYRQLKTGMMQELLTGKKRLV
ncbi:MAG: restriction endonuclease subunit S [Candidatus Electrothrix sp. AR5]|nr:restriction endonuclease subunit S [Candidatus Electrothrix sp. AR5]